MAALTAKQKEVYFQLREKLQEIDEKIDDLKAQKETLTLQADDGYDEYVALIDGEPVDLLDYWLLNNELDELYAEEKRIFANNATYEEIMAWHRGPHGRRCSEIENTLGI